VPEQINVRAGLLTRIDRCPIPVSPYRKEIMKSVISAAAAGLTLLAAQSAFAAVAPAELAQQKACLGCHAVDKKIVGPAYKDVAAKYKGQKDALAKLSEKVIKGGSGVWGPVPMPANNVTPDEAKTLVTWVLSQK
jgi:cytochrome c